MAANGVNKSTHIYSSKSADQLISTKDNMAFIPNENIKTDKQKPEHDQ